jgi:hypothetical protein
VGHFATLFSGRRIATNSAIMITHHDSGK